MNKFIANIEIVSSFLILLFFFCFLEDTHKKYQVKERKFIILRSFIHLFFFILSFRYIHSCKFQWDHKLISIFILYFFFLFFFFLFSFKCNDIVCSILPFTRSCTFQSKNIVTIQTLLLCLFAICVN